KKLKNELSYNSLIISDIGEGWGFSKIYCPFILLWVVNKLSGYLGLRGRVCLALTCSLQWLLRVFVSFCQGTLSGNHKGLPLQVLWIPCRLPVWTMTQANCAITCGRQGFLLVYGYKINKTVELCKDYACKVGDSLCVFCCFIWGERG
ncbi:hypothetical protein EZS27_012670, partial [termite gut metagenome]